MFSVCVKNLDSVKCSRSDRRDDAESRVSLSILPFLSHKTCRHPYSLKFPFCTFECLNSSRNIRLWVRAQMTFAIWFSDSLILWWTDESGVAVHTYTTGHMLDNKVVQNLKNCFKDSLEREASCEWALKSRSKDSDAAFQNVLKEL